MDTPQDLTAVESLLADREALRGWIERLDDAGSTIPETVRQRVRADYRERLDGVTDQLRGHADTIAAKLADDRAEHAELLAQATSARDALAEAELRFAVGEYDQGRYDSERTSHASDVETYDLSLGAVAERISGLEDVHRLVTATSATAGTVPQHAPVFHEHTRDDGEAEMSGPGFGGTIDDEPPAIGIGEFALDDTESLLAIFDDVDTAAPSAADGDSADEPDDPPSLHPSDEPGPLSFRRSATVAPEHDTMRAASARFTAPADAPGPNARGVDIAPRQEPVEPAADRATAASRTTRCGECGAMNLPMEWYCEKCGAELTTI
ncbi:MAG: hypothetical protein H0W15_10565 [Gemmatimonadales bacterium]|nr:hypothetical protein [Gemmatimonadales bacterium]